MPQMIQALWNYRGFIKGSVKRDFQSKYQNSLLGAAWTVLNPLAMIVVYTVIFANVMHSKLPGVDNTFGYSIYLCAGVLTWGFFSEITLAAQNMFLQNANLLKKISFPRLCLPVVVVANATLNFAIVFTLFSVFLLLSGSFPGWSFLALFLVLAIQILFSVGLGLILGVLNVFFRDVGQFFGIALTFWFWLTPIVYPAAILPEAVKRLMHLNPMFSLIQAYQGILVQGEWPDLQTLLYPFMLALVFCAYGFTLFRKHSGDMIDEL